MADSKQIMGGGGGGGVMCDQRPLTTSTGTLRMFVIYFTKLFNLFILNCDTQTVPCLCELMKQH